MRLSVSRKLTVRPSSVFCPVMAVPTVNSGQPSDSEGPTAKRSGRRAPSGWYLLATSLIALIALGVGLWARLQPAPAATISPHFSDQQVAEARGRACAAFNTVHAALSNTLQNAMSVHNNPGSGSGRGEVHAASADARLAMADGATYLLSRLEPATPAPLATEIHSFAENLQDIVMNGLGGISGTDPVQTARLRESDAQTTRIADLCK